MSENKQLPAAISNEPGRGLQISSLEDLKGVAQLMLQSGIFADLKDGSASQEQALAKGAVKILAGQELGIPAFAAMKGIHLIKGKATPSYQMIGAIIKKSPRHDYKVLQADAECAKIEFFFDGKSLGVSKFDTADMQRAGLGGDTWKKYPQQMRFARAMTIGANLFCPEIFSGPIYSPEEMGAEVDEDGDPIVVDEEAPAPKQTRQRKAATGASEKSDPSPKDTATENQPASDAPGTSTEQKKTQQEDSEIVNAEVVDESGEVQVPGPEALDQILQAAVSNGWSEQQAEGWLGELLTEHAIDLEQEPEAICAAMGFKLVEVAVNHFLSNKPE